MLHGHLCLPPIGGIAQLEHILLAAARLVGGFSKFDHVMRYMHDILYWFPISQRIEFRITIWVWRVTV